MSSGLRRRVRRAVRRHHRALAATCLGLAALVALEVLAPTPEPTSTVVVAARDLAAGSVVAPGDLLLRRLPRSVVADGALVAVDDVVGHALAGPVRRGEALTDLRLAGTGLLAGLAPGEVGVPLRVADPAVVGLLRVGDRVDVHAVAVTGGAGTTPGVADVVVADLLVVALPGPGEPTGDLGGGAVVVVSASRETARLLARAAAAARFSLSLRPPR